MYQLKPWYYGNDCQLYLSQVTIDSQSIWLPIGRSCCKWRSKGIVPDDSHGAILTSLSAAIFYIGIWMRNPFIALIEYKHSINQRNQSHLWWCNDPKPEDRIIRLRVTCPKAHGTSPLELGPFVLPAPTPLDCLSLAVLPCSLSFSILTFGY